jgi:hypothetical protein
MGARKRQMVRGLFKKLKKSVKNNPLYMVLFSTEINQVDEINSVIESYIN